MNLHQMTPSARASALGRGEGDFGDLGLEMGESGKLDIDDLARAMQDFELLACLHVMADIVGDLARLSKFFQTTTIGPSEVSSELHAVKTRLQVSYLIKSGGDPSITWGPYASKFLSLVPNIYGANPGPFKLGRFDIKVAPNQVRSVVGFAIEFSTSVLNSLDDAFPEEPILAAFSIFEPSRFKTELNQRARDAKHEAEAEALKDGLDEEAASALIRSKLDGSKHATIATYGASEIARLLSHFNVSRGEEPFFPSSLTINAEWMSFKCGEFLNWSSVDLGFRDMLKLAVQTLKVKYPNLCRLFKVILVLPMSNAACEGGFRMMKLIKSDIQGNMKTETIDIRMFITIHGPSIGTAEYETLMRRCCAAFWSATARSPGRVAGARASHEVRKEKGRVKKLAGKRQQEIQTKAANAVISASGTATSSRPAFSRAGYEALPPPSDPLTFKDGQLASHIFVEADTSHTWVLGKIRVKTVGEVETFEWKSTEADRGSDWDLSLSKPFKLRSYGNYWVYIKRSNEALDEAELPAKEKKGKKKKRKQDSSNEYDDSARYKKRKGADRSGRLAPSN